MNTQLNRRIASLEKTAWPIGEPNDTLTIELVSPDLSIIETYAVIPWNNPALRTSPAVRNRS